MIVQLKKVEAVVDGLIRAAARAGHSSLNSVLKNGLLQLKANVKRYTGVLEERSLRVITREKVKKILRPYGASLASLTRSHKDQSLQHFLQFQLDDVMQLALDTNLALSPALRPGRLHEDLLAAKLTGEEMSNVRVDYHNPFATEHAFNFSGGSGAAAGLVKMNVGKYGFTPENELALARQVALINAVDHADDRPQQHPSEFLQGDKVEGWGGINWRFKTPWEPLQALGRWLINGLVFGCVRYI